MTFYECINVVSLDNVPENHGIEIFTQYSFPQVYLRYIFEKLPVAETLEDYEALLPWNITLEQLASPAVVPCA